MKVFKCKKCGKVFLACVSSVEGIIDNNKDIRKYQRRGFVLEDINDESLKDIKNWCHC